MCCIDEHLGSDKTNHRKDDGRLLFKYGNMGKKVNSFIVYII